MPLWPFDFDWHDTTDCGSDGDSCLLVLSSPLMAWSKAALKVSDLTVMVPACSTAQMELILCWNPVPRDSSLCLRVTLPCSSSCLAACLAMFLLPWLMVLNAAEAS